MTDVNIVSGSSPVSALAMVSADQVTVLGNGTAADPLRLADAAVATTFTADTVGGNTYRLGQPQFVTGASPSVGIDAVTRPADAAAAGNPTVAGLVIDISEEGPATLEVQIDGIVDLATARWDTLTGGSGGLARGQPYFLSATPGNLTLTAPSAPGTAVVLVGVALSSRKLQLAPVRVVINS